MSLATRRDVATTRRTLVEWLGTRLGARDVRVDDLEVPRAGFSNETLLCRAGWTGRDGVAEEHRLVVRIEPTTHRLFLQPDALFQARVLRALAARSPVPVPHVRFVEPDPAVLGAPFYVMDHVVGRIPPDVPSWHRRGWVLELTPAERARLHDHALGALVALHAVDVGEGFDVLAPGVGRTGLEAYLDTLGRWVAWAWADLGGDADTVAAGLGLARRDRPATGPDGLVWGDARPGNVIVADDLSVAALLDFETATLGPPGIDLGWWVVFEEYLCEAQGLARLDGVPGRDETVRRYAELGGRPVGDIAYYEVLATLVLCLITSRLARLLEADGFPAAAAREFADRATRMLRRRLDARG